MAYKYLSVLLLHIFFSGIVAGLETENLFGYKITSSLQHPYQVSIQFDGSHWCGGSLIADDIVLSAAHCFANGSLANYLAYSYKVLAGVVDLNQEPTVPAIDVSYIYLHQKFYQEYDPYGRLILLNDIAVLKLKDKFKLSKSGINKVKLPEENQSFEGQFATATGFGADVVTPDLTATKPEDKFTLTTDNQMHSIAYTILSSDRCDPGEQHICGDPVGGPVLPKDSIYRYSIGTCGGDSGGPLVVYPSAPVYPSPPILVGIVSYGPGNCDSSSVHHFTEVSHYVTWIANAIRKLNRPDKDVIDVAKRYADWVYQLYGM